MKSLEKFFCFVLLCSLIAACSDDPKKEILPPSGGDPVPSQTPLSPDQAARAVRLGELEAKKLEIIANFNSAAEEVLTPNGMRAVFSIPKIDTLSDSAPISPENMKEVEVVATFSAVESSDVETVKNMVSAGFKDLTFHGHALRGQVLTGQALMRIETLKFIEMLSNGSLRPTSLQQVQGYLELMTLQSSGSADSELKPQVSMDEDGKTVRLKYFAQEANCDVNAEVCSDSIKVHFSGRDQRGVAEVLGAMAEIVLDPSKVSKEKLKEAMTRFVEDFKRDPRAFMSL